MNTEACFLNAKETYTLFDFLDEKSEAHSSVDMPDFKDIKLFRFEDEWDMNFEFATRKPDSKEEFNEKEPLNSISPVIETAPKETSSFNIESEQAPKDTLTVSNDEIKPEVGVKRPKNKVNLAERKDVVNRAIMRGIKKYFLESFLKRFPDYKNKRICRVYKPTLLTDVTTYCGASSESDYLPKAIF